MTNSGRPPVIVDTHLHLDEPAFDADRDEVLQAARRVGVERFVNIAHLPERWQSSQTLRERHGDIDIVLGVHPQHADLFDRDTERELRDAVRSLRPVAIGETGLDFFRSRPARNAQDSAFRAQLALAEDFGLPVIIHQRQASDELIDVLEEWPNLAPIVLHSFDGTARLAEWAIERGCFIGIGGLATRTGAESLRAILSRLPADRLLLETDSPYLSPPAAPERRNTPANLPQIASLLAPIWNLSGDELCQLTTDNAAAAFGFGETSQPNGGPRSQSG